jgi:hypothetical protein
MVQLYCLIHRLGIRNLFLFSQEDTDMSYNYTAMHIILMIKELLTIFTLNGPEPMCLSNLIYTLFFVHNAPINDI